MLSNSYKEKGKSKKSSRAKSSKLNKDISDSQISVTWFSIDNKSWGAVWEPSPMEQEKSFSFHLEEPSSTSLDSFHVFQTKGKWDSRQSSPSVGEIEKSEKGCSECPSP